MVIDVIKHVSFEDAANIGVWARQNGHTIREHNLYDNDSLPDIDSVQFAAVMGGPMNVYDYDKFTWLKKERDFIDKLIDKGKCVIGVCLGAQLLADALGAKVTKNKYTEIGWWEIEKTPGNENSSLDVLENKFIGFHWHGDTFDIPVGARKLARSQACENQAFEYGANILALQFHIEYSQSSITKMIENCGDEIQPERNKYIQNQQQILKNIAYADTNKKMLFKLLDDFYKRNKKRLSQSNG